MTRSQSELLNSFDNVYSMEDIAGFEIPDPYGQSLDVYRKTAEQIKAAVDKIIDRFFSQQNGNEPSDKNNQNKGE